MARRENYPKSFILEMATAQRTRPRAVVDTPHHAEWQLKSALVTAQRRVQ